MIDIRSFRDLVRLFYIYRRAFVIAEALFGYVGNSMALIADAGHNLSDVLGLAVAWGAAALSKRPPSARYTYGLRGSSILAALFNAVFLLLAVGAIAWEAVVRLFNPEPVASWLALPMTVFIVAAGLIQVPEGRRIFPRMSVAENLQMGADAGEGSDDERAAREEIEEA